MEARTREDREPGIRFPERDGRPMAESDTHREEMQVYVIEVLEDLFAGQPDVYVAGNNFVYYDRADPKRCVSPDAYVVKGIEKRRRRVFKVWEEGGHTPCIVFEITSESTRVEDRRDKVAIYRDDLHVPEYFLFDPLGEWVRGQLRGYRLVDEEYLPIAPVEDRLSSRVLGLDLLVREGHLRFLDPRTGALLSTRSERADAADARARAADARAAALAAEVERLRAENERLRGEGGPRA
jgi:Uma2 family endonuclease